MGVMLKVEASFRHVCIPLAPMPGRCSVCVCVRRGGVGEEGEGGEGKGREEGGREWGGRGATSRPPVLRRGAGST